MKTVLTRMMPCLALGFQLLALPAIAAEVSDHDFSEWRLGAPLFGDPVTESDLEGKVIVLEYWGVNCPPCIASLPHLAKLDKRYRNKGLRVIGAESQGSKKDAIKPLIDQAKVKYSIIGSASGPIKVAGIPRVFVFGRDGKLIFDGRPSAKDFERTVSKAIRQKPEEPEEAAAVPTGPLIASRSWTNADGREIRAAVKSVDETSVTFQMSNGKDVVYPLEKLSKESREAITAATTEE